MTAEQTSAFLDAIRERPDDDLPRLAYADRLEEDGNADRAEFIRVECELARTALGDPRRAGLDRRATELLRENEAAWRAAVGPGTSDVLLSRGLFTSVTASAAAFLRHGGAWVRRQPIYDVHLREVTSRHVDRLARCRHLRSLTRLTISCSDGPAAVAALSASPHLTRLRSLYLRRSGLRAADVERLAAAPLLARLSELFLYGEDGVGDCGVQALADAPAAATLDWLCLGACRVGDGGAEALAASRHLAGLYWLNLDGNAIGNRGFVALASSGLLSGTASVRDNAVTHKALRAVAATDPLRQLGQLNLSGNPIGRIDPATVAVLLDRHPGLTLDLSDARVPDRVVLRLLLRYPDRVWICLPD